MIRVAKRLKTSKNLRRYEMSAIQHRYLYINVYAYDMSIGV